MPGVKGYRPLPRIWSRSLPFTVDDLSLFHTRRLLLSLNNRNSKGAFRNVALRPGSAAIPFLLSLDDYLKRNARFPWDFFPANETPTVLSVIPRDFADSFVRSRSRFETASKSLFLVLCFLPPTRPPLLGCEATLKVCRFRRCGAEKRIEIKATSGVYRLFFHSLCEMYFLGIAKWCSS